MLWAVVTAVAGLALVVSAAALLQTRRANQVARNALARAAEAHRFAVSARELGQEATAISRRIDAVHTEQHVVDWEPNWRRDDSTLVLSQLGADDAYQVTVVVTGEGLHEVCRVPQVSPGEDVLFDLPQVEELRREHEAEQLAVQDRLSSGSSMIFFAGRFEMTLRTTVAWVSAAGMAKTATLGELRVR